MSFILRFYKRTDSQNAILERVVCIDQAQKCYQLLAPGYGPDPYAIYVDQINEDGIQYRKADFYDEKPFGRPMTLRVFQKTGFTQSGSRYDHLHGTVPTLSDLRMELYTVEYFLENIESETFQEAENVAKAFIVSGAGDAATRERVMQYLFFHSSHWISRFVADVYRQGLYGFPKDEGKIFELCARDVDAELAGQWYGSHQAYFEELQKINNLTPDDGKEDGWAIYYMRRFLSGKILMDFDDDTGLKNLQNAETVLKNSPLYQLCLYEIAKYIVFHPYKSAVWKTVERYATYLATKNDALSEIMDTRTVREYNENTLEIESEWEEEYVSQKKAVAYVTEYAEQGDRIAEQLLKKYRENG